MSKTKTVATQPAATQIETPFEIAAQRQHVLDLQDRIKQLNADLNAAQNQARVIRAGGHDVMQPGLPADFVSKVQRDYPTTATKAAAEQYEAETIAPMRQQLRELELQLQREIAILNSDWNEFREANAPALAAAAAASARQIEQDIQNLERQQSDLRQRITKINSVRLQRLELQSAHDAAVAAALANNDPVPEMPVMPESPTETPPQIEGAIKLLSGQIEAKREQLNAARAQHRSLMNLIDTQRAQALIDRLVTEAKTEGVSMGVLRDKLVELAGETALSLARASGEADALARLRESESRAGRLQAALDAANSRLNANNLTKVAIQDDAPTPAASWGTASFVQSHPQQHRQAGDAMITARI